MLFCLKSEKKFKKICFVVIAASATVQASPDASGPETRILVQEYRITDVAATRPGAGEARVEIVCQDDGFLSDAIGP